MFKKKTKEEVADTKKEEVKYHINEELSTYVMVNQRYLKAQSYPIKIEKGSKKLEPRKLFEPHEQGFRFTKGGSYYYLDILTYISRGHQFIYSVDITKIMLAIDEEEHEKLFEHLQSFNTVFFIKKILEIIVISSTLDTTFNYHEKYDRALKETSVELKNNVFNIQLIHEETSKRHRQEEELERNKKTLEKLNRSLQKTLEAKREELKEKRRKQEAKEKKARQDLLFKMMDESLKETELLYNNTKQSKRKKTAVGKSLL